MSIILYRHNQETYNNIQNMFKKEKRVGVVQPTGTGKSFLFLKWIENYIDDRFIILSPSEEIFNQLKEYAKETDDSVLLKNVEMITYQKLIRMNEEEIESLKAEKIIVDEYHRTGADIWGKSFTHLLDTHPNTFFLGATATPVRYLDNGRDMSNEIFDNHIARVMTLGEAVQKEILPMPEYIPVWYDMEGKLEQYQNDIDSIRNEEDKHTAQKELDKLKRHLENSYGIDEIFSKRMPTDNGKFIVFCRDVKHVEEMKSKMSEWMKGVNNNIHMYTSLSYQNDKDIQLSLFKQDNDETALKFLFTVDRFNEGVHIKGIDGIIMLRPTISPIIYLQQMGRALASNNKSPVIFDMVNNYASVQITDNNGISTNVFEKEFRDANEKIKNSTKFKIFDEMVEFNSLFQRLEDTLYLSNEEIWLKKYKLYKDFKSKFKREPIWGEIYQGVNLGNWVSTQRHHYRSNTLSKKREELLKAAAFVFIPSFEDRWNECFKLYKEYKLEYLCEPTDSTIYKGINLGGWCHNQRNFYRQGCLKKEREKLLKEAGFVFERFDQEAQWMNKYKLLLQFVNDFNRLPKRKEKYQDVDLREWIRNQLAQFKNGMMSKEHEKLLREIGVDFTYYDNEWLKMLNIYKEYRKIYDKNPEINECYKGYKLGEWCNIQKKAYKKGYLSDDKEKLLLEAGFIF